MNYTLYALAILYHFIERAHTYTFYVIIRNVSLWLWNVCCIQLKKKKNEMVKCFLCARSFLIGYKHKTYKIHIKRITLMSLCGLYLQHLLYHKLASEKSIISCVVNYMHLYTILSYAVQPISIPQIILIRVYGNSLKYCVLILCYKGCNKFSNKMKCWRAPKFEARKFARIF